MPNLVVPHLKSRLIPAIRSCSQLHPQNPSSTFSTSTSITSPQTLSTTRLKPNNRKASGRVYPIRKQFIFETYIHLLTQYRVCLFFRHESLTPTEWNSIRGQLAKLSINDPDNESKIQIQVLRTKMIAPVLKHLDQQSKLGSQIQTSLSPHLNGNLACLTQRAFHPSRIQAALKILSKHAAVPTKAQMAQMAMRKANQPPIVIDRLPFVMGMVDQKVQTNRGEVELLSQLPSLDTLRQMIVGLVASAGTRIVGTLNLARGRSMIRTVDGYRATLEKEERGRTEA